MATKESDENSTIVEIKWEATVQCISEDFYTGYGYVPVSILGTGMTGDVMMVAPRDGSNNLKAVKTFIKKTQDGGKNEKRFIKEVSILQSVKHKHILGNTIAFDCPRECVIVMPYFPEGTLKSHLEYLTNQLRDKYLIQLTSAIFYLHSRHVAHMDIKVDNILVSDDGDIVLTDFGLSCMVPSTHLSDVQRCGTENYMAPELKDTTTQFFNLFKCDMYSLGVVLYSMLASAEVDQSDVAIFFCYQSKVSTPDYHEYILKNLLERDPEKRWDSNELGTYLSSLDHMANMVKEQGGE